MIEIKSKLNERLKELRYEKRVFQKDVAKHIGLTPSGYANYEQGKKEPSISTLIRLAHFFNVSVGYLVGDED